MECAEKRSKRSIKLAAAVSMALVAQQGALPVTLAAQGTWVRSGARWWYSYDNGSYPHGGWEKIDGAWYLFDASGWMLVGWQKSGGTWYYLRHDGSMLTGWHGEGSNWYYLGASGAMVTGWRQIGGAWYSFRSDGVMRANTWDGDYYLGADGIMLTSTITPDGQRVGPDGKKVSDETSSATLRTDGVADGWMRVGRVVSNGSGTTVTYDQGLANGQIVDIGYPAPIAAVDAYNAATGHKGYVFDDVSETVTQSVVNPQAGNRFDMKMTEFEAFYFYWVEESGYAKFLGWGDDLGGGTAAGPAGTFFQAGLDAFFVANPSVDRSGLSSSDAETLKAWLHANGMDYGRPDYGGILSEFYKSHPDYDGSWEALPTLKAWLAARGIEWQGLYAQGLIS